MIIQKRQARIARAAAAAAAFLLSAGCSAFAGEPIGQVFACSFEAVPAEGQTFASVHEQTFPHGSGVNGREWELLLRERNQYVGPHDGTFEPEQTLVIPVRCPDEEPAGE